MNDASKLKRAVAIRLVGDTEPHPIDQGSLCPTGLNRAPDYEWTAADVEHWAPRDAVVEVVFTKGK